MDADRHGFSAGYDKRRSHPKDEAGHLWNSFLISVHPRESVGLFSFLGLSVEFDSLCSPQQGRLWQPLPLVGYGFFWKAGLGCCPFRAGRVFCGETQGGVRFADLPWAIGCGPVGAISTSKQVKSTDAYGKASPPERVGTSVFLVAKRQSVSL